MHFRIIPFKHIAVNHYLNIQRYTIDSVIHWKQETRIVEIVGCLQVLANQF